ncbi:MAG: hypothetical protein B7Y41_07005 [Hydrogenophilales bacterium 28-61-23]|nr:MAG: hypothetical protein B7Y41_07005 [Hydrogenophilales bacterium 28-61-23]
MDAPTAPPAAPPGKPRLLDCPVCGGAITLRAVGHSVNVACMQCNSLLDVALEEVKILKKAHEKQRDLSIPLGARGKLDGIEWEAVGYQERSSGSGSDRYVWDETLLFNPYHGFRFLAQAQGHWSLYRVIKSGTALPAGTRFARFFSGQTQTDYVLGEFYWRARMGDQVHVTDSISPPYVMSTEKNGEEINVSLGAYLAREEVAAAFGLDPGKLPRLQGIAPNQPSPFAARVPGVLRASLLAVALATGIQLVQAYSAKNQVVHNEHLTVTTTTRDEARVTMPFELEPPQANVCLESAAILDNNWAELSVTLVDASSQERRSLNQGMESYSGVDSGEAWREGDNIANDCFPAVPGGQYRLIFNAEAGALGWGADQRQIFYIQARRDVPIWSNWFALLLALLPYPFYLWLRHHSFEYTRWSDSDFMPESYASIRNSLNGEEE